MLKFKNLKKLIVFAGATTALLLVSVGVWTYASPYTYVSMDVNPSIEFTVNRFNRVIGVNAVNDDGTEILQELSASDITNASINNAIISALVQIIEEGYFEGDRNGGIVIATSGQDMRIAGDLAEELQQTIELIMIENGTKVEIESFRVDQDSVDEALEMGVTPGKLKLVRILKESANGITEINEKDWLSKPVKDIIAEIKLYINAAEANASNEVTSNDILEEDREDSLISYERFKNDDADDDDQDDDADNDYDRNDGADDDDQDDDADDDDDRYVDKDDDNKSDDDDDDDDDRYIDKDDDNKGDEDDDEDDDQYVDKDDDNKGDDDDRYVDKDDDNKGDDDDDDDDRYVDKDDDNKGDDDDDDDDRYVDKDDDNKGNDDDDRYDDDNDDDQDDDEDQNHDNDDDQGDDD